MKLTLSELESCFGIILEMLRARGEELIEVDSADLYWSVLSGEWLDFQKEPQLGVGSLGDDIQELRKVLDGESTPSIVDLERIAAILRFLSDAIGD